MPLIFLLACLPPAQRESLEVLAFLEDGQLFEARFTKGDTGILKGQGYIRVNRWIHRSTTMSFHMNLPPQLSSLTQDGADFFTHQLYRQEDIWKLQMRSDEFNASVYFRPQSIDSVVEQNENWNIDLIHPNLEAVGWTTAEERSALLKGSAALFRRSGTALLESERYLFLGYDSQNYWGAEWSNQASFGWGMVDQISYRSQDVDIQSTPEGIEIKSADKTVIFKPERRLGRDNQYNHLSSVEKQLSSPFLSTDDRSIIQGYFVFSHAQTERMLPGIVIYHGQNPPKPKRSKKQNEPRP